MKHGLLPREKALQLAKTSKKNISKQQSRKSKGGIAKTEMAKKEPKKEVIKKATKNSNLKSKGNGKGNSNGTSVKRSREELKTKPKQSTKKVKMSKNDIEDNDEVPLAKIKSESKV